ncbi:MAG TPA: efflux RND transporter periplasmic adaptor subunit [Legionella sp.]|nr:efflux RND transporter periplasmic adaptor subunit [Legionella sp.]
MLKRFPSQLKDPSRRSVIRAVGFVLICLLIIVGMRVWAAILLHRNTNRQAIPIVKTVIAARGPMDNTIVLPGDIRAWHEAPIYARTSGYIKQWYVDIGDQVRAGTLLADIEAPELDAQLRQAEADLKVTIEQNKLAQSTAIRWVGLLTSDAVSKQETDEKVDAARALSARVIAARANRDKLRELVGFERITAPFEGTISARATDIGDLINAGSNTDEKPLFRLVQTDPLRVYVKIPQSYATRIAPNMQVDLHVPERPGRAYKARLVQTARAIDPKTRTLLAQFVVDNKKGQLLPGSYTDVYFKLPASDQTIRLPINTLLFRSEGLQVATLDEKNHVVLKSVSIRRDFGTEVEMSRGVHAGDRIIINPSDSITNGEQVRVWGDLKSAH